jgi:hypothetical protein
VEKIFFFISGIFQILIRGKMDRRFTSFVSLIENLREEEQKKQPYNIELRQEVVVTVTQAKRRWLKTRGQNVSLEASNTIFSY